MSAAARPRRDTRGAPPVSRVDCHHDADNAGSKEV